MITCSKCGRPNREGIFFCEECGAGLDLALGANATIPTRRLQTSLDDASAKGTWGPARFASGSKIIVHILDSAEPLTISPSEKLIFGRSDTSSTVIPDIDLTPYGALEKGVSRQHAALEVNEDTLIFFDIGSANGTFLNGQRLLPNQPRVLRDGDEIRFGKLVAHIYFK